MPEPVTLATRTPLLLADFSHARPTNLPALHYPAPGPAVVLLGRTDVAAELAKSVAVLAVDPWARPLARVRVGAAAMLADAFAALAVLAARGAPRITLVGVGECADAAVLAAYAQVAAVLVPEGARFAAHVALGPVATRLEDYRTTGAPVAIAGAPGSRHDLVVGDLVAGGSPVENLGAAAGRPGRPLRIAVDGATLDDRSGRPLRAPFARARLPRGRRRAVGAAELAAVLRIAG